MDFPIPPSCWWSTDILSSSIFLQGVDQKILPCGQGRIDSVKINPSLLMMTDCFIGLRLALFHWASLVRKHYHLFLSHRWKISLLAGAAFRLLLNSRLLARPCIPRSWKRKGFLKEPQQIFNIKASMGRIQLFNAHLAKPAFYKP